MRRLARILLAAAVMSGVPACDEDPTGPRPGVLDVLLVGPAGQVGALLFHVEGGAVDSVVTAGYFTASARFTGVERRVLVAGDGIEGVVARIYVADLGAPHRAFAVEVADGRDYRLLEPAGYTLTLLARPF